MKKLVGFLLVLTLAFAISACSSKTSSDPAVEQVTDAAAIAAATELQLKASDKTFKFDKPEYTIKKDEPITLTLVNESGVHGLSISGLDVALNSKKLTQTIIPKKAGTYTISCTVPCGAGHMTMNAKIIVV
jgi:cytochrome c oxidase subunit 2